MITADNDKDAYGCEHDPIFVTIITNEQIKKLE